jgi:hypothetical protein
MIEIILNVKEKDDPELAKKINYIINKKDNINIKVSLKGNEKEIYKIYEYLRKNNINVYLHPDTPLLKNLPF